MMPIATARSGSISTVSAWSVSRDILLPWADRLRSSSRASRYLFSNTLFRSWEVYRRRCTWATAATRPIALVSAALTSSWVAELACRCSSEAMICRGVADAVVDFAQQHFAFGGKRRVAVARGVDLGLGLVAGFLNLRLAQRAVDGDLKQRDEIALTCP